MSDPNPQPLDSEDSDIEDHFYTPPPSLPENVEYLNAELLMKAIAEPVLDREGVLNVLNGFNKWIIVLKIWYLRGRHKVC